MPKTKKISVFKYLIEIPSNFSFWLLRAKLVHTASNSARLSKTPDGRQPNNQELSVHLNSLFRFFLEKIFILFITYYILV